MSRGQADRHWPPSLDALVAAPASHELLFETARVRVLEVMLKPGAREPEHIHRWPSVMIVDRPARTRYYRQGVPMPETPEAAHADRPRLEWLDAEGPHAVEDIDGHTYHAIRVEMGPEPPTPRGAG